MPIVGRFGSLAGLGSLILPGGAMESIATVTVGSGGAASISFTSIPGTYQHLHLRVMFKSSQAISSKGAGLRFNSDSGNNYARHDVGGNGSGVETGSGISINFAPIDGRADTANQISASIVDILDYASTSKNKVMRTFFGMDNNGSGGLIIGSALWMNTNAITEITLYGNNGAGFAQHSTAALYGLRAP